MKKYIPITLISLTAIAVSASIAVFSHKSYKMIKADPEIVENTVTLNTGHITSSSSGSEGEGGSKVYFASAALSRELATLSGQPFGTADDFLIYGNISASANTGGHILIAEGGAYSYGDVYFTARFDFSAVDDFTLTINGKFYYNEYKTDPEETSLTYNWGDLSGTSLNIYESGLYKAEIDSIVVDYSCII